MPRNGTKVKTIGGRAEFDLSDAWENMHMADQPQR